MYHKLNPSIARRYGVNAALIAEYIWKEINNNEFAGRYIFNEIPWMRSSHMMFTAAMPYLSKHTIRRALELLMKQGVIVRGEFGSPFDRTSWYAFTQFGRKLMEESEDECYE